MLFQKNSFYFFIILLLFSCKNKEEQEYSNYSIHSYYKKFKSADLSNWHHKDILDDSIIGISTDKAYNFLESRNKQRDTIIVAIIDSELDITQEDLKNQIWTNKDEIPNNNIDDDDNGYVDDIHGWNYTGTKLGDSLPYVNYEFTRIIRKYAPLFKNIISEKDVPEDLIHKFYVYNKALKAFDKELEIQNESIADYNRMLNNFLEAEKVISIYFPNKDFSTEKLDSLNEITTDKIIKKRIRHWKYFIRNNIKRKDIEEEIKIQNLIKNIGLKIDFNDRYMTRDDPDNINDKPYGNNNIQGTGTLNHATNVASIIGAKRNNNIGVDGINDKVKIMALSISVAGNEFDKDIALAIRYAVDNGAKVINMSIGKSFSLHSDWVNDAMKYANEKDILIITSAGNEGHNLSKVENYPNDMIKDSEFIDNFIKVGNTSNKIDSLLVYSNSNYSKTEVDIFAPGKSIKCLDRNKVTITTGTSFAAPMVTGVASLIFSYYPNLSAKEVKEIILSSGISIKFDVLKPYANDEKRDPNKVPFSSLSKSGKIVNAYNALLLAEKISKKKSN